MTPGAPLQRICAAHPGRTHQPAPRPHAWQEHHPVVRAWQRVWQPPTTPYPGTFQGEVLWDARTVWVPATCHLNVHDLLVEVMRAVAKDVTIGINPPTPEDVDAAGRAVAHRFFIQKGTETYDELVSALVSPTRFIEAGGDLRVLFQAGAWGEA